MAAPQVSMQFLPVIFLMGGGAEISSNFDLENMISTYTKDFPLKKWPKFARFL
jgi:hypothetical protein